MGPEKLVPGPARQSVFDGLEATSWSLRLFMLNGKFLTVSQLSSTMRLENGSGLRQQGFPKW